MHYDVTLFTSGSSHVYRNLHPAYCKPTFVRGYFILQFTEEKLVHMINLSEENITKDIGGLVRGEKYSRH